MERITIEVQDDGRVSVTAESPDEPVEQMDFDSVAEAAGAVQELLMDVGEGGEMAEPAMAEGEMDAAAMWDEEAARRPAQPNMMA